MSEISNPDAPQGVQYEGGEATDIKSLSNEDFKRFLQTPRDSSAQSRFSYTDPSARNILRTPRCDSSSDGFKKPKPKAESKKSASKYRDRAAERRDGAEDEYAEGVEILRHIEREEDRETAIEHSKILGGNMENTHLVKGLDFALFQKKQREMEDEERLAKAESAKSAKSVNMAGKQIIATALGFQTVESVAEFKTTLGKQIHRSIFTRSRPESVDTFLPGRTTFVYDLDPDMNLSIPTVVMHPKDELYEQKDLIWCLMHADIIKRIGLAVAEARDGKLQRRPKRKEREGQMTTEPTPSQYLSPITPLDTKISLFDDVDDDYAPSGSLGQTSYPADLMEVDSHTVIGPVDNMAPLTGPTKPSVDVDVGYPDPDSFVQLPKRQKID